MKRLGMSMSRGWVRRSAERALLALIVVPLLLPGMANPAAPRRESPTIAALRQHVETLASDEFEGREPGTEGESKTLRYLARQWFDAGLESGTNDPANAWFAPVELVEREPLSSRAAFQRGKRRLAVPGEGVFVVTSGIRGLVENAPVVFVGKWQAGTASRTELAGRIALVLDGQAGGAEPGKGGDLAGRLIDAGASAVITVLDGDRSLDDLVARRRRAGYALADERLGGDIEAFVTPMAAEAIVAGSGADLAGLRRAADEPGFTPRPLGVNATLEATSRETRIKTHNLIGRLEGRRSDAGAVLLVAHWDHFGRCAEPPAEDLICNGAVDNASGLAVLTETARALSRGRPLERDVYFLATTGEELGLLGALAFTENPPVPLDRFVAVFNIDSTGIAAAGQPVSVVGAGMTPLDPGIAAVARALKRRMATTTAANSFVRRQDSWVFMQHDLPAVMVSTSYSDPARLERFMEDSYHRPSDSAGKVDYGGMADDLAMQIELVRYFADPRRYAGPPIAGIGTP